MNGILYFGLIVFMFFVLIRHFARKNKTTRQNYLPDIFDDCATGYNCIIQKDYGNTFGIIREDTKGKYVTRKKRNAFDRSNRKEYLTPNDYLEIRHEGHTRIYNNLSKITGFQLSELKMAHREIDDLKNEYAIIEAENMNLKFRLKGLIKQELDLMTKTHEKIYTLPYFKSTGGKSR
jgi:hypothetical protein